MFLNELTPKVSVIIPIYNGEKYLTDCLDSVIAQTYKNYEVICIDDGSTDRTAEICDGYAREHSNIRVMHIPNGGVSNARNIGMKMAIGEYISFLDADDVWDKNLLSLSMQKLLENKSDAILFDSCDFDSCNLDDLSIDISTDEPEIDKFLSTNEIMKNGVPVFWVVRFIVKKSVCEGCAFNTVYRLGEDILFLSQLLKRVKSLIHIKRVFYYRRIHAESAVHSGYKEGDLSSIKDLIVSLEKEIISAGVGKDIVMMFEYVQLNILTTLIHKLQYSYKKNKSVATEVSGMIRKILLSLLANKDIAVKTKMIALLYSISPALYYFIYKIYRKF